MSNEAIDCTAGNSATWTIEATEATTGTAFDLTGWDAYMAVTRMDTLGSPVLLLSNTGGTAHGITIGTASSGLMDVAVTPQQTAALDLDVYEYSVYVMPTGSTWADSPDTRTLLSGTLSVDRVARDES